MVNKIRFYNPKTNEDLDKQYMYTLLHDGVIGKLSKDDKIVEFIDKDEVAWEVVGNRYPERLIPSIDKGDIVFGYELELNVICPECGEVVMFDTLPYYRLLNIPFEKEKMCEYCRNILSIEGFEKELAEDYIRRFDYTDCVFEIWSIDKGKEITAQLYPEKVNSLTVLDTDIKDIGEAKRLCMERYESIQSDDSSMTCCIMVKKKEFVESDDTKMYFDNKMIIPYFIVEDLWIPEEDEYDE